MFLLLIFSWYFNFCVSVHLLVSSPLQTPLLTTWKLLTKVYSNILITFDISWYMIRYQREGLDWEIFKHRISNGKQLHCSQGWTLQTSRYLLFCTSYQWSLSTFKHIASQKSSTKQGPPTRPPAPCPLPCYDPCAVSDLLHTLHLTATRTRVGSLSCQNKPWQCRVLSAKT